MTTAALISGPYRLKAGSTRPLRGVLVDGRGEPIDLSDATGVRFVMTSRGAEVPAAQGTCTILQTEVDGKVVLKGWFEYDWGEGETALADIYNAEWSIDRGGGTSDRVPNDGYAEIEILPSLFT
jgi:hypothetical protein